MRVQLGDALQNESIYMINIRRQGCSSMSRGVDFGGESGGEIGDGEFKLASRLPQCLKILRQILAKLKTAAPGGSNG